MNTFQRMKKSLRNTHANLHSVVISLLTNYNSVWSFIIQWCEITFPHISYNDKQYKITAFKKGKLHVYFPWNSKSIITYIQSIKFSSEKSATNVAFGPILRYLCSENKTLRNKSAAVASSGCSSVCIKTKPVKKVVSSFRVQQMQLKKIIFRNTAPSFESEAVSSSQIQETWNQDAKQETGMRILS